MHLDWTIPIGTVVLIIVQLVGGALALMRLLASLQRGIDKRFAGFELLLNTFKEGDLRELKMSVGRLESGQDEWTKTLRNRTHELGEMVTGLLLRVDRLERPERYGRRDMDNHRRDSDSV